MYNKFVKILKSIYKEIRALNKNEKETSKIWIDIIP